MPLTPAGSPVTVAPVAPPPTEYVMLAIADKLQTVCAVVLAADVLVIVETVFIVTEVVVVNTGQPPAAAMV